jgi:lantibiotic modifying enzyme
MQDMKYPIEDRLFHFIFSRWCHFLVQVLITHWRISTLVNTNKNKEKIEQDLDQKMTSPTVFEC